MVPLSVEVFLGHRGLREGGGEGDEGRLAAWGHPGRIENWRSSSINRLGLVTNGWRGDKAGPR